MKLLTRILLNLLRLRRDKRAEVVELRRIATSLEYIVFRQYGVWLGAPINLYTKGNATRDVEFSYDDSEEEALADQMRSMGYHVPEERPPGEPAPDDPIFDD